MEAYHEVVERRQKQPSAQRKAAAAAAGFMLLAVAAICVISMSHNAPRDTSLVSASAKARAPTDHCRARGCCCRYSHHLLTPSPACPYICCPVPHPFFFAICHLDRQVGQKGILSGMGSSHSKRMDAVSWIQL